jgi:hypothetical protein
MVYRPWEDSPSIAKSKRASKNPLWGMIRVNAIAKTSMKSMICPSKTIQNCIGGHDEVSSCENS